jgi:signal transduction histidine kinase
MARVTLRGMAEQYSAALREYCAEGGEAALLRAYQLGRAAVGGGYGVLEISSLHQDALVATLLEALAPDEHARVARRASEFFAECIAPFELSRRGIQEAHATLRGVNQGLEQRLSGALAAVEAAQTQIVEQRKAAQIRNDLIAVVSHEMRTPLTSIHGSLNLLQSGVGGALNDSGRRLLELACRNSQRLVRLVNDVLDLQRLESGAATFNMRVVSLRPLLEQALDVNQSYAGQMGITLRLRPPAPSIRVRVDTDHLMQVMANLLSNAAKFSPSGATVTIDAARQGPAVRVAVTDHGPGVPPHFRDRIFQKFAQAETSSERKGSGLGLSITKAIVESMGGSIGFDSESGRTTFYFDLPEWRSRAAATAALRDGGQCVAGR